MNIQYLGKHYHASVLHCSKSETPSTLVDEMFHKVFTFSNKKWCLRGVGPPPPFIPLLGTHYFCFNARIILIFFMQFHKGWPQILKQNHHVIFIDAHLTASQTWRIPERSILWPFFQLQVAMVIFVYDSASISGQYIELCAHQISRSYDNYTPRNMCLRFQKTQMGENEPQSKILALFLNNIM